MAFPWRSLNAGGFLGSLLICPCFPAALKGAVTAASWIVVVFVPSASGQVNKGNNSFDLTYPPQEQTEMAMYRIALLR